MIKVLNAIGWILLLLPIASVIALATIALGKSVLIVFGIVGLIIICTYVGAWLICL